MILKYSLRPAGRVLSLRSLILVSILLTVVFFHYRLPGAASRSYRSGLNWISGSEWEEDTRTVGFQDSDHGDGKCDFPGGDRVVITVKTGATEAASKIPTQLLTSLRCAPHVLIFSDMEQQIGEIQVHDALDTIDLSVTKDNSDFDIYRKQYELRDPLKISSLLGDMKDPRREEDLAAWTLDKYKNLHILEKAWALKPDMDWYLHIDADTYVLWPSLMAWLRRLDPSKETFMGSVALINEMPFAHGGSGILLSREAMRNFVVTHNGTSNRWDPKVHENCCGDWILAQVMKEYGIPLTNTWPTINGETPSTVPFADDHWCQPAVTMHHMSSEEAQELGTFEQRRNHTRSPITYAELFHGLISDSIPQHLDNWDNLANDETITDIQSMEECTEACMKHKRCFQARYNGEHCKLGTRSIILGTKTNAKEEKKWRSSWNKTQIKGWVSKQRPCKRITFPSQ